MSYQSITGLNLGRLQYRENINASHPTRARLTGLEPNTDYRIYLTATTIKGKGEAIFLDAQTLAAGRKYMYKIGQELLSRICIGCEIWWKCVNFFCDEALHDTVMFICASLQLVIIGLRLVGYWHCTGNKLMPEWIITPFTDAYVYPLDGP